MARESLGYVRLEWTCPNCQTKNLGSDRFCASCGASQPEDIEFEQAAHEEIITDEAEIAKAKAGPDIHCYYCGSRNRGDAKHCTQCGADLSEGVKREAGQVLGALRDKPAEKVICPSCGTPNEADAAKCTQCGASLVEAQPKPQPQAFTSRPKDAKPAKVGKTGLFGGIGLGLIGLLICAAIITFFILAGRTEDLNGVVRDVSWTRNIAVEGLVPVTHETWRDEIPADAVVDSCAPEIHHTQDQPAPNSEKVCGTPYVVDQGSGYGEVVQDCEYRVYEDFCEYTVEEWRQVDTLTVNGSDFNPRWPAVTSLTADQRSAEQSETYQIVFDTENGRYTYTTSDPNEFTQFQPGSRWTLKINTFNQVTDVEPGR